MLRILSYPTIGTIFDRITQQPEIDDSFSIYMFDKFMNDVRGVLQENQHYHNNTHLEKDLRAHPY